jgi:hypothetical protein
MVTGNLSESLDRQRSVWHVSHTEWFETRRYLLPILFKFPLECVIRDVLPNKKTETELDTSVFGLFL